LEVPGAAARRRRACELSTALVKVADQLRLASGYEREGRGRGMSGRLVGVVAAGQGTCSWPRHRHRQQTEWRGWACIRVNASENCAAVHVLESRGVVGGAPPALRIFPRGKRSRKSMAPERGSNLIRSAGRINNDYPLKQARPCQICPQKSLISEASCICSTLEEN